MLQDVKSFCHLRPGLFDEITAFFAQYNALDGKQFHALGTCSKKHAHSLITAGMKKAKKG